MAPLPKDYQIWTTNTNTSIELDIVTQVLYFSYTIQTYVKTLKVKHSAFAMFSYFLFQFCLKCAACHYTFRFLPALRVVSWPAAKKSLSKVVTLIVIIIVVLKVNIIINNITPQTTKSFYQFLTTYR